MKINQLIWVINGDTKNIIPVKIVEKVIKETASGSQTAYTVMTPAGKKSPLSDDHLFFQTLEEAKNYLVEAAMALVSEVVRKAQVSAEKLGVTIEETNPVHLQDPDDIMEPDADPALVTLPDGRVARLGKVKLPETL
jgi:hypothetical protein